ncbi:hypothetical protein ACQ4PT_022635 [Festuca glaucescens]
MDADSIVEYFRGKSILITGSTGFLGKVLVEKILRVQSDIKKLFLLIRASDVGSAKIRIQNEIPVDMVVNAMMVSMAAHPEEQSQIIYHVTSSVRNPAPYAVLAESSHRYFFDNPPCTGRNGKRMQLNKMRFFSTIEGVRLHMAIKYKLPLEMLHLVALCGVFSRRYNKLSRKYRFVMQLIELYAPFSLFKGCFDDMNLERLRMANKDQNNNEAYYFDFDPKSINWDDYFYRIHIPGVLKYMCDGVIFN